MSRKGGKGKTESAEEIKTKSDLFTFDATLALSLVKANDSLFTGWVASWAYDGYDPATIRAILQKDPKFTEVVLMKIVMYYCTLGTRVAHDSKTATRHGSEGKKFAAELRSLGVVSKPKTGEELSVARIVGTMPVLTAVVFSVHGREIIDDDMISEAKIKIPKAFRWPGAAALIPIDDENRFSHFVAFHKLLSDVITSEEDKKAQGKTDYAKITRESSFVSDDVRRKFISSNWSVDPGKHSI